MSERYNRSANSRLVIGKDLVNGSALRRHFAARDLCSAIRREQFERKTWAGLFVPQAFHGIDARGAVSRHVASEQCDDDQK